MNIEIILTGPFAVNCGVIWGDTNEALIIDPGCDATRIAAVLAQNNLSVAAYLLTHGHADHISALAPLHAEHPAPIHMHAEDEKWAFGDTNQIEPYYSVPAKPNVALIYPEQSSGLNIGGFTFQCIETPGHTPGGVCYWFEEEQVVFTGDTLFKGTCGRTDLPNGNARTLSSSLKKLEKLPDATIVWPGHNESTTIGHEKATNFFMQ